MEEKITTLQELTGHEAGAVQYDDGTVWVGNWTQILGLPRILEPIGSIGLGDDLSDAAPCDVPEEAVEAMQEHEQEQGAVDPRDAPAYSAWTVRDAIVVVSDWWH